MSENLFFFTFGHYTVLLVELISMGLMGIIGGLEGPHAVICVCVLKNA